MEQPKFEHSILEEDIKRLSLEIKSRGLAEKGKKGVKTVIQEQTAPPITATGTAAQPAQPAAPPASSVTLPSYLDKETDLLKLKVEKLLDLALHKGVNRAAEEARDNGPLVVDAFHDALTDKLYDELKQRGLI